MTNGIPTREEALAILHEFTASDALRRHAYAVEAAMRAYGRKLGEDEHAYGVVGLLHDFDYEKYPTADEHPLKGSEILKERGIDEEIREGILAHAPHTGRPRDTRMKKAIFACDELCGLIMAVTYVRPSKKIAEVTVESVLKKFKNKGFAAKISRDGITQGAAELGVPLEEHISTVLAAMQGVAAELGV
jgi:predicted hydrolase (HD superfamily)